jgi:predicted nuclease of predicted toxin-antitoxin system
VHPRDIGLSSSDDGEIWDYAKVNDLIIVSKDADFYQRSLLIWAPAQDYLDTAR